MVEHFARRVNGAGTENTFLRLTRHFHSVKLLCLPQRGAQMEPSPSVCPHPAVTQASWGPLPGCRMPLGLQRKMEKRESMPDLTWKLRTELKPQRESLEKDVVRAVSNVWTTVSCKIVMELITLHRRTFQSKYCKGILHQQKQQSFGVS